MPAPVEQVRATTGVVAVLGSPIRHSLSPVIQNAAFAAAGLDLVMVAFEVAEHDAGRAIAAMRTLGIRGASVTMPLKSAVVDHLDALTPVASALGAVNCIVAGRGQLVGDSTDGEGFVGALRADFALDPRGLRCVVLGAGGAARAVVHALAGAGASSVTVINRSEERGRRAAALGGDVGHVAPVGATEVVADAELVVNATSVGMAAGDGLPLDPAGLHDGQAVVELIYHPARTALMDVAERRGCRTSNGLSMLVHQAAAAYQRWTDEPAPLEVMAAAVRGTPGQRSRADATGSARLGRTAREN